VPHGLGTAAPPGTAGPAGAAHLAGAVGLAGEAAPASWKVPGPMHLLSRGHNLDERDPPRKRRFDRMDEVGSLGSMGPLVRPINHHNRHSKAILGVPGWRQFITRHEVGPIAPRGLAAPPNRHTRRNRPKAPTLNRLRGNDQGRPRREAADHRAGCTPWSGRTFDIRPTRSTDLPCL
jgi:hypothetical protein